MSIIPPGLHRQLQFYLSGPLPCPYVPGQVERKLFTRLTHDTSTNIEINGMLTRAGFRRSHDIAYRPACAACNACVPVRVPVRLFQPSKSLKRVTAHNRDLRLEITNAEMTPELYHQFIAYQQVRHADGDMAHMTEQDFADMLQDGAVDTRLYSLRDASGRLMATAIADPVSDGLSAVYSFYAPGQPKRSLGTQLILCLIEEMQRERLPYVYLGYWIKASRKMAYKARFQPLQALTAQGWDWLED